jgi:hypothetical protein
MQICFYVGRTPVVAATISQIFDFRSCTTNGTAGIGIDPFDDYLVAASGNHKHQQQQGKAHWSQACSSRNRLHTQCSQQN